MGWIGLLALLALASLLGIVAACDGIGDPHELHDRSRQL